MEPKGIVITILGKPLTKSMLRLLREMVPKYPVKKLLNGIEFRNHIPNTTWETTTKPVGNVETMGIIRNNAKKV